MTKTELQQIKQYIKNIKYAEKVLKKGIENTDEEITLEEIRSNDCTCGCACGPYYQQGWQEGRLAVYQDIREDLEMLIK